ncbi:MAG: septum formation initiator family protein [Clostridia bacterium]|nr:septum formation initiator family protein [Clostridia bacterium]
MVRAGNSKQVKKKYKVDYLRVILVVALAFFSVTFVKQQLEINEYNVQINSIEQDIAEAKEKTAELKSVEDKVNDSDYIEEVARTELGLVKPYEKIFIDVDK